MRGFFNIIIIMNLNITATIALTPNKMANVINNGDIGYFKTMKNVMNETKATAAKDIARIKDKRYVK